MSRKPKALNVVDLFCGAGGSSTGMHRAFGALNQPIRITAVNHWDEAIKTHSLNHPEDRHLCSGVFELDPHALYTPDEQISVLWASPSCTHFSLARGGKPCRAQPRSLATVVVTWALKKLPAVILVENVKEFMTWGPLMQKRTNGRLVWEKKVPASLRAVPASRKRRIDEPEKFIETTERPPIRRKRGESEEDYWDRLIPLGWGPAQIPDPKRKGEEFKKWVADIKAAGYVGEWKILCAADYGDPTIRKRFFFQAHRIGTGRQVVWPEPTHAKDVTKVPGTLPWRTAREIINWGDIGESIFRRKRPLAPKTLKRIYAGLEKYGLKTFIVPQHAGHKGDHIRSTDSPVSTVTCEHRGEMLVNPFLVPTAHAGEPNRSASVDDPMKTITGNRGDQAVVQPMLVEMRGTSATHLAGAARNVDEPVGTVTAGGTHHGLMQPVLVQVSHGNFKDSDNDRRSKSVDAPLGTQPGSNTWGVAQPFIVPLTADNSPESPDKPLSTVTTGPRHGIAQPFLVPHFGEREGQAPRTHSVDEPTPTVTASKGTASLATPVLTPFIVPQNTNPVPYEVDQPVGTILAEGSGPKLVQPVLRPFTMSAGGPRLEPESTDNPVRTVLTRDGQALVTPLIVSVDNNGGSAPGGVHSVDMPTTTTTTKARHALATPWLYTYYTEGGVGGAIDAPAPTVTCKERMGLCYPVVEFNGAHYYVDIYFRMLQPDELSRAQGFPKEYQFTGNKTDAVRMIGNSNPPGLTAAITLAAWTQDPMAARRLLFNTHGSN